MCDFKKVVKSQIRYNSFMLTAYQKKQLELVRQMESLAAAGISRSTIVPILKDYPRDPQRTLTSVVFLPVRFQRQLYIEVIQPLQKFEPDFYYYPLQSLHITIQNIRIAHFPGRYNKTDITKAQRVFRQVVPKHQNFNFHLYGAVALPTSASIIVLSSLTHHRLVWDLRRSLASAGLPDDKNYFSEATFANCNICRFTHEPGVKFHNFLRQQNQRDFGQLLVKEISLIETNAVCHPWATKKFGVFRLKKSSKN